MIRSLFVIVLALVLAACTPEQKAQKEQEWQAKRNTVFATMCPGQDPEFRSIGSGYLFVSFKDIYGGETVVYLSTDGTNIYSSVHFDVPGGSCENR